MYYRGRNEGSHSCYMSSEPSYLNTCTSRGSSMFIYLDDGDQRSHQWSPVVISSHQWSSAVTCGHQRSPEVTSGQQRSAAVSSGHLWHCSGRGSKCACVQGHLTGAVLCYCHTAETSNEMGTLDMSSDQWSVTGPYTRHHWPIYSLMDVFMHL